MTTAPTRRRDLVAQFCAEQGRRGTTWREFGEAYGLHHGAASSALSAAHAEGLVVRLQQRRGADGIYVLPAYIGDRPVATRRSRSRESLPDEDAVVTIIEEWLDEPGSVGSDVLARRILGAPQKSA